MLLFSLENKMYYMAKPKYEMDLGAGREEKRRTPAGELAEEDRTPIEEYIDQARVEELEREAQERKEKGLTEEEAAELEMEALEKAVTIKEAIDAGIDTKEHQEYTAAKQELEKHKAMLPDLREEIKVLQGRGARGLWRRVFPNKELAGAQDRYRTAVEAIKAQSSIVNDIEQRVALAQEKKVA